MHVLICIVAWAFIMVIRPHCTWKYTAEYSNILVEKNRLGVDSMDTYTEQDRLNDFKYFVSIYQDLYNKYGESFIALKNKKILGAFKTVNEAIQALSDKYKLGTYIIQECNGDESGYTASIMTIRI